MVFTGLQKEFCDPIGALYGIVREELDRRRVVAKCMDVMRGAIAIGVKVFLVPIIFTEDYRELRNPTGILRSIKDLKAFRRGTPGVECVDELLPLLPAVRILRPKRGLCAFGATELGALLQDFGIRTLAVGGLLTNVCVESTARTAYDLGYEVVMLSDCTATKSPEEQRASERFVFPLLGRVMPYKEFLAALRIEGPPARV